MENDRLSGLLHFLSFNAKSKGCCLKISIYVPLFNFLEDPLSSLRILCRPLRTLSGPFCSTSKSLRIQFLNSTASYCRYAEENWTAVIGSAEKKEMMPNYCNFCIVNRESEFGKRQMLELHARRSG